MIWNQGAITNVLKWLLGMNGCYTKYDCSRY